MKFSFNINSLTFIFLLFFFVSCSEDFLNRPPKDELTIDTFYKTEAQLNTSTSALYGFPWFEFNDKVFWSIGEAMSGNYWTNDGDIAQFFNFSVTQNNPLLYLGWSSLFRVIAHSNAVINNVPERAEASIKQDVKDRVVAEAKFMRATAYFYLVRLWGAVPIIENTTELAFQPKIPRNKIEDVYEFIIRDLTFASEKLPLKYSGGNVGRVTSWAAKGMLAKVYLTRAGLNQSGSRVQDDLDQAKTLAGDVIKNSGLQLSANYEDLFKLENENSAESLFALQWISCQSWGTQNTTQAYWANSGDLTGVGDGWGGYFGPTISLQRDYENGDKRRKATIMQNGDSYPELMKGKGGYKYVVKEGDDINESATFAGVRKYIIGSPGDVGNGKVCNMSIGLNTYILRLADVYLIYAEAILGNNGSTSDAMALKYFNEVRKRAGLLEVTEITLNDILKERRLEFAFESEYWYDLKRIHDFNPSMALGIISDQERGIYEWDDNKQPKINSNKISVSDAKFILPLPAGDLDKNPRLLEEPVSYVFKK